MRWRKKLTRTLRPYVPASIWAVGKTAYFAVAGLRLRLVGREYQRWETTRARPRREREGFFDRYCQGAGIDIGYGGDPVTPSCRGWDFEHGDAHFLKGVPDESFDFVYSSHTLEHMDDPEAAIRNWWRVLKPGGHLLLYIPHRDLYEKRMHLPSRWNAEHKHFFLVDRDDLPDTIGVLPLLSRALTGYRVIYAKACDEGHTITDPSRHSDGEYSIEAVVQKCL
jgi:SAM-dependent methyltransferase